MVVAMADWVVNIVGKLGYAGIALLMLLENVFPPIPSELIMPLAGLHTADGGMSFAGAVTAGSIGSLLGTLGWYWIGLRVGERRIRSWVERHGRWLALEAESIDHASEWFQKHGAAAVFFCRMIPGLRTLISLPAGFHGMSFWRLLLPSAAGTVIWTAGLTYAGRLLGSNYMAVKDWINVASWIVLGSVVVTYLWRQFKWYRRRQQSHAAATR